MSGGDKQLHNDRHVVCASFDRGTPRAKGAQGHGVQPPSQSSGLEPLKCLLSNVRIGPSDWTTGSSAEEVEGEVCLWGDGGWSQVSE